MSLFGGNQQQRVKLKYTDQIGISTGVAIDAETAFTATYKPKLNGRITKLKVVAGGIAATTLIECGYVKIEAVSFGGLPAVVLFSGAGLQTVPKAVNSGIFEEEINLPVNTGSEITIKYYYNVTPVTPELIVSATFETP